MGSPLRLRAPGIESPWAPRRGPASRPRQTPWVCKDNPRAPGCRGRGGPAWRGGGRDFGQRPFPAHCVGLNPPQGGRRKRAVRAPTQEGRRYGLEPGPCGFPFGRRCELEPGPCGLPFGRRCRPGQWHAVFRRGGSRTALLCCGNARTPGIENPWAPRYGPAPRELQTRGLPATAPRPGNRKPIGSPPRPRVPAPANPVGLQRQSPRPGIPGQGRASLARGSPGFRPKAISGPLRGPESSAGRPAEEGGSRTAPTQEGRRYGLEPGPCGFPFGRRCRPGQWHAVFRRGGSRTALLCCGNARTPGIENPWAPRYGPALRELQTRGLPATAPRPGNRKPVGSPPRPRAPAAANPVGLQRQTPRPGISGQGRACLARGSPGGGAGPIPWGPGGSGGRLRPGPG